MSSDAISVILKLKVIFVNSFLSLLINPCKPCMIGSHLPPNNNHANYYCFLSSYDSNYLYLTMVEKPCILRSCKKVIYFNS